ncbi:MAG: M48 family metallopeptidase [Dissulfurispiraceae bacterium]|nr:M48 family metallopeptidase [Dissulfurispiraceae bacterium]
MPMILTSHSDNSSAEFAGSYYDGKSSRAHSVSVIFNGSTISINGPGIKRTYQTSSVKVSEPLDNAHLMLTFKDGSACELPDSSILKSMLAKTGRRESLAVCLQSKWTTAAFAFLFLILLIAAGYKYALPVVADAASHYISDNTLSIISSKTLQNLDINMLKPSDLTEERQSDLRRRMSEIKFADNANLKTNIEFRNTPFGGPNAFALPDGTIVFFDSLVNLADNDEQLAAVYAHEAGHVYHRHGVRMMIQSSAVALVLASYFGDVSSIAGALTGLMLNAKYSRDFERQADDFAAQTLLNNNLSPTLLGDFLMKLERKCKKKQSDNNRSMLYDYISSHPAAEERAREMQRYIYHK